MARRTVFAALLIKMTSADCAAEVLVVITDIKITSFIDTLSKVNE